MGKAFLKPFGNWFGYSRRERRATFILMLIILIIAGVRYVIPQRKLNITVLPEESFSFPEETLSVSRPPSFNTGNVYSRTYKVIELNSCDSAELVALPGIGPVLASRIIKFRNLLGGYARPDQLREVYGLPQETYDLIAGRLKADSTAIKRINVNSADYRQLIRLPYFDKNEVSAILKYRDRTGKIESMGEIVEMKLISSEKINKISPYLEF